MKNWKSMLFFLWMILSYGALYWQSPLLTRAASDYALSIIKDLIPILLMVYLVMVAFSFIKEKRLKKVIEKAPPLLQLFLMAILGTLSHGPIYAWYPFLQSLAKKGISLGGISSFLYARGIKLTLLPMLFLYFEVSYGVLLTMVTFLFAILQGAILDFATIAKRKEKKQKIAS